MIEVKHREKWRVMVQDPSLIRIGFYSSSSSSSSSSSIVVAIHNSDAGITFPANKTHGFTRVY